MSLSNKAGSLVLTTGNKSELAVGYCTLYGDMAGGFAVIRDVPKTLVYALARWRNGAGVVIPQSVLDKPPSAELRPGQLDTDSLPPYEVLDPILEAYVEDDASLDELVAKGFDRDTVADVVRLVDGAEYKRRQARPAPRSPAAPSARTAACPSPTASGATPVRPDRRSAWRSSSRSSRRTPRGATAALYAADLDEDGYVANSTKAFGHRPAVFAAWRQLGTPSAAPWTGAATSWPPWPRPGCCAPAIARWPTARSWRERFLGAERTIALATGAVNALDPLDAEIVRFATLVTREPASVTASDVERPRPSGCPTRRSSTSSWPWPPAASSAPCSRPSAPRPTRPTGRPTRSCGG